MRKIRVVPDVLGFEWDSGNLDKNWLEPRVTAAEFEEVFFNDPLLVLDDPKHSLKELRYYALGRTDFGRLLFAVFTIRESRIRAISVRDMHKKERAIYETE